MSLLIFIICIVGAILLYHTTKIFVMIGTTTDKKKQMKYRIIGIVLLAALGLTIVVGLDFGTVIHESEQIYESIPEEQRIEESVPLVAINDNLADGGRVFLSIGYYDENLYYFLIKGDNKTGYRQEKIRADSDIVAVFETDNADEARIEYGGWYKPAYSDGVISKSERYVSKFIHIFVPKGTIVRDYEINAK